MQLPNKQHRSLPEFNQKHWYYVYTCAGSRFQPHLASQVVQVRIKRIKGFWKVIHLIYLPIGWVVPFSMAAATASASLSQFGVQQEGSLRPFVTPKCPWIGSIALQVSFPVVSVPVLSKAIEWQAERASKTCPPFNKIPYRTKWKGFINSLYQVETEQLIR